MSILPQSDIIVEKNICKLTYILSLVIIIGVYSLSIKQVI